MINNVKRVIQFISGVNKVHHIHYSYGYKIPFLNVAYFPTKSFGRRHGVKTLDERYYHNCTITGIY